eukprot:9492790-Pyramimonas_sp.AAC.1
MPTMIALAHVCQGRFAAKDPDEQFAGPLELAGAEAVADDGDGDSANNSRTVWVAWGDTRTDVLSGRKPELDERNGIKYNNTSHIERFGDKIHAGSAVVVIPNASEYGKSKCCISWAHARRFCDNTVLVR